MKHYLWELRPYFRHVSGELIIGSICGILMNTMVVLPAVMLGRAIDVTLAFDNGQASMSDVTWAALAFLGGTLATQVPRLGKRWWLMTANARIRANIRSDAMRGVLAWPMERLHTTSIGELMARIVADVEVLGVGVREFSIEMWDTVLFSISFAVTMFIYDSSLTILALFPTPFAMLLAQATGRWVRKRTTAAREANANLTTTLQEQLAGIRVLKLFGRTGASSKVVEGMSQKLVDSNLSVVRLREGLKPVYSTVMMAGIVLVVALGGQRVIAGAMTVGAFVTYIQLFLQFTGRGYRIPQLFNSIQSGGAAYSRLKPLLAPARYNQGEPHNSSFQPNWVNGLNEPIPTVVAINQGPVEVSLQNITFRYPGAAHPALQDVSINVPAGSLVAITGPVGCGKSALLRATLGLYPLEDGEIYLNGRPLTSISTAERAGMAGYLPQDPFLFSGTISENIVFGSNDIQSHERVVKAAQAAILGPDLQTFSAGVDTQIGELGTRVSGGQRQRIALARSLAAAQTSPGMLVLDDPFSAVDLDTEAQLIASLRQTFGPQVPENQRATILLSSHRLAAFPQADRIIVLDHGRILETGTHSELMKAGGLYARIFQAQALVSRSNGQTKDMKNGAVI
jgi:ABC-type multidrug transport system fused ATPase/permease subunit